MKPYQTSLLIIKRSKIKTMENIDAVQRKRMIATDKVQSNYNGYRFTLIRCRKSVFIKVVCNKFGIFYDICLLEMNEKRQTILTNVKYKMFIRSFCKMMNEKLDTISIYQLFGVYHISYRRLRFSSIVKAFKKICKPMKPKIHSLKL